MKKLYKTSANLIFTVHSILVIIILFGGLVPEIKNAYLGLIILSLISDLKYGYCILSKWEYVLRKKVNPKIDYDFTWTTHYTYTFTNGNIRPNFYERASLIFLSLSLLIHLYFRFVI
ncbi:MAG: hypothetical protein ACJAV6_000095 [Candidatus Paceibacteria bacterium]|jgi:hypothetical protein